MLNHEVECKHRPAICSRQAAADSVAISFLGAVTTSGQYVLPHKDTGVGAWAQRHRQAGCLRGTVSSRLGQKDGCFAGLGRALSQTQQGQGSCSGHKREQHGAASAIWLHRQVT